MTKSAITIQQLEDAVRRRNVSPRPGVTICVTVYDEQASIDACDAERVVRVEASPPPTVEGELDRLVDEAITAISDAGMLMDEPVQALEPLDTTAALLTCDPITARELAEDPERRMVVAFAGRCLHIPAGESTVIRQTALRRFFGGSHARSMAHGCLRQTSRVVAAAPPDNWKPLPSSFAVLEGERWTHAVVGGAMGPLGASQTLRTWQQGCMYVATAACHVRLESPPDATPVIGGAAGHDEDVVQVAATAEACERYLGGVIEPERVRRASLAELGDSAIDPTMFVSYTSWQYQTFPDLHPFDPQEQRLWVDVERLDGQRSYVLAELVHYPFGPSTHRRHTSTCSSGMAAHTDPQRARQGAVRELIERDAFMRLWVGGRPGRLVLDWREHVHEELVDELTAGGWAVEVLQIGDDPREPVLLAVVTRERQLAVGASAGDPVAAATKAVSEAWVTISQDGHSDNSPRDPDEVWTPADHAKFALAGRHRTRPTFVDADREVVRLSEMHHEPRWPDDLVFYRWDERRSRPFHVVRALSPTLIPISFGRGREPYGRPDMMALMGAALPKDLPSCPDPHPFP